MTYAFLPILALIDEELEEEEAAAEQAKEKQKQQILNDEANGWKTDQDIINSYGRLLNGDLGGKTGYKIYFSVDDFLMALLKKEGADKVAHVLKKGQLFKKTLDERPDRINEFILATSYRSSSMGRVLFSGSRDYYVEKDIWDNRAQLFLSVLPSCPCAKPKTSAQEEVETFRQESLIKTLEQTYIKSVLAKDSLVPSAIMTRGDQAFLKMYRDFLMTSDYGYEPDVRQIDEVFTHAAKGAYRHQVAACQYVRVTKKEGWLGTSYPTRLIPRDNNGKYRACPVMSRHLDKLRRELRFKCQIMENMG